MTLNDFFSKHPKVAIAFSGGVDSAYLLYEAKRYASEVKAYYVKSPFQPVFELEDAQRLAKELNADMEIINLNVLEDATIVSNPANRCYYCKQRIFATIIEYAAKDGYSIILDGTNASDDVNDRPGIRALQELKVLSPLQLCGITKDTIRKISKDAGLFTWNKPAYACLATRIPTGDEITLEKLEATEKAEGFLMSLGFSDFRIRRAGNAAKLQVKQDQLQQVLTNRELIVNELKNYYSDVYLDMEVR